MLLACSSMHLTPWLQVRVVQLQTLLRKPALQVHFLIKCGRGLGVGTVTWGHLLLLPLALSLDDLPWETRGDGSLESTGLGQAVRLCRIRPSHLSTSPLSLQTLSQPLLCSSQPAPILLQSRPVVLKAGLHLRQKSDCSTPLAQLGQQDKASWPPWPLSSSTWSLCSCPGFPTCPPTFLKGLYQLCLGRHGSLGPVPAVAGSSPRAPSQPPTGGSGSTERRLPRQPTYSSTSL